MTQNGPSQEARQRRIHAQHAPLAPLRRGVGCAAGRQRRGRAALVSPRDRITFQGAVHSKQPQLGKLRRTASVKRDAHSASCMISCHSPSLYLTRCLHAAAPPKYRVAHGRCCQWRHRAVHRYGADGIWQVLASQTEKVVVICWWVGKSGPFLSQRFEACGLQAMGVSPKYFTA